MADHKEVFFSIDIETDGPIPVRNSMLSFACVAFAEDGSVIDSFERNLKPLPGATQDERTMTEFWDKQDLAWNYCTQNTVDAKEAMTEFVEWVRGIPAGQRVAVCMPAGFDFTFMYMYMMMFVGDSPFSFSCIDMKTYVSAFRKQNYRNSGKRSWPARWFDKDLPHTHKAIDDAIEQGLTFMKMRAENLQGPEAVANVRRCFWNSRGGKPGVVLKFEGSQGSVKVGSETLTFTREQYLTMGVPSVGDSVKVVISDDGSLEAVHEDR